MDLLESGGFDRLAVLLKLLFFGILNFEFWFVLSWFGLFLQRNQLGTSCKMSITSTLVILPLSTSLSLSLLQPKITTTTQLLISLSLLLAIQAALTQLKLIHRKTNHSKFKTKQNTPLSPPPKNTTTALLVLADDFFLLYSIPSLPISRILLLTSFSSTWAQAFPDLIQLLLTQPASILHNHPSTRGLAGLCMLIACFTIDLFSNLADFDRLRIGYLSLLIHLTFHGIRTKSSQLQTQTATNSSIQKTTSLLALGFSLFLSLPSLLLLSPSRGLPYHSLPALAQLQSVLLPTIPYAVLNHLTIINWPSSNIGNDPKKANNLDPSCQIFRSMMVRMISCVVVGMFVFEDPLVGNLSDGLVGMISYLAISTMMGHQRALKSGHHSTSPAHPHITMARNPLPKISHFARRARSVIRTILNNSESRKIYFFLCLNLAFMLVQITYGIWTNSLGLISDSIHMFFDCMALGMGLFASVMATWPADKQFTYGYGRVETLSGFANGIFLMLISIFIVFEAVQRLVDPPEMNTNKLLVVSFLGLMVNLVGMFATGHHHHHVHSHGGCGHDHGHSHNMKGVFLHVMADTLGSVGVIISTLLIERFGWTGFDPIASIFIALLIFASVVPLVQDSAKTLMLCLDDEKEVEIRKALGKLSTIEGLSSYSAPRFWPKDSSTIAGSIHLQLAPSSIQSPPMAAAAEQPTILEDEDDAPPALGYCDIETVKQNVTDSLRQSVPALVELTIQVEGVHGSKHCFCLTATS